MGRTIAIGDIHGCYNTTVALIDKIKYDDSTDKLIFVGDYIDRGPNSYESIQYLKTLVERGATCLRGNHEQMAIDSTTKGKYLWMLNGGEKTLDSYSELPTTLKGRGF